MSIKGFDGPENRRNPARSLTFVSEGKSLTIYLHENLLFPNLTFSCGRIIIIKINQRAISHPAFPTAEIAADFDRDPPNVDS